MISVGSLPFGQLVAGDSLLHRLDPRTKFLGALTLTSGLFLVNTFPPLIVVAAFCFLLCGLSRLPWSGIVRALRPVLFTILGASFLHLFVSAGPYLVEWGPIKLSQPGLVQAGLIDLRLVSILVIGALVSWTTSPMALTDGLDRLLGPLDKVGLPVHELAIMVGITFRFVPTTVSELQRLMKAQMARGVDFSKGGLIQRARQLVPLVIPLIVALIERAEELAVAMESRCYHGRGRTRFRQLRMTVWDYVAMASCLALVVGTVVFPH